MAIICSDDFLKAMKASVKFVFIKIEIYDSQMNFIKELTKDVTREDIGSISVDASRPIRRSFSFSLKNLNNEYDWSDSSLFWLDKRIKLFIGLKLPNGTIEYIPQGVFILTEPSDSHTLDGKIATIQGQDKAYMLTDRRGKFINTTTIETGANIAQAIKTIAGGAGETLFNFDTVTETVPYELVYEAGTSRWEAISELAILAKCTIYYDVYGYLRLRNIDLNEFSTFPTVWSFNYDQKDRFYAGNTRKLEDTICNRIIVLGGSGQTATQRYELVISDSDPRWTGSPYTVEKIGDILYYHNDGNPDPLLGGTDNGPVFWRAKYEMMKRLSFTERLSLSSAPLYILDANDIVGVEDSSNSVTGKYLIESFSLPITPQLMDFDCIKYNKVLNDWDFV